MEPIELRGSDNDYLFHLLEIGNTKQVAAFLKQYYDVETEHYEHNHATSQLVPKTASPQLPVEPLTPVQGAITPPQEETHVESQINDGSPQAGTVEG